MTAPVRRLVSPGPQAPRCSSPSGLFVRARLRPFILAMLYGQTAWWSEGRWSHYHVRAKDKERFLGERIER